MVKMDPTYDIHLTYGNGHKTIIVNQQSSLARRMLPCTDGLEQQHALIFLTTNHKYSSITTDEDELLEH